MTKQNFVQRGKKNIFNPSSLRICSTRVEKQDQTLENQKKKRKTRVGILPRKSPRSAHNTQRRRQGNRQKGCRKKEGKRIADIEEHPTTAACVKGINTSTSSGDLAGARIKAKTRL